jgi:FHS family L-fucose permease-like MFS transporter
VGAVSGVLIGTWFIFSGVEKKPEQVTQMKAAGTYSGYLHTEILRVVPTYVGLAAVLLLLALAIARIKFPAISAEGDAEEQGSFGALLQYPHLWLAVVAQFFYVGAQVATWSTFIPYMKQYTALSERNCGYFLTGTLVALAAGRIVSTALMRYVEAVKLTRVYALINVCLLTVAILRPGMMGTVMIFATSFFMSVMFPTIFALGVKGLGPNTKLGGSLIVMAILGGAVFPPLMGVVKQATGSLAQGYWLPALGFALVAVYGFLGSGASPVEVEAAPIV